METRIYSVPAISCGHCKAAIEGEVSTVPGVAVVEVDVAARSVRVEGEASDEEVRAAIDAAGFDVVGFDIADPTGVPGSDRRREVEAEGQ